jgi:putative DNA primase/helicase
VDLRTGDLLPHNKESFCTRKSPVEYDPNFVLPEWDRFLHQACEEDDELVRYLQRAAGYSLTGDTKEEVLFLITGPQASGKSTFISGLQTALGMGNYAESFDTEMIMVAPQYNRLAVLANATGARMVSVVELPESRRMDEAHVKTMTGGDMMQARQLFKETFSFRPKFKLWIATNHDPMIRDQAIWRRIKKVPFERSVPVHERDPRLKAMIEDPSVGGKAVLNWMVQGCLQWQSVGLKEPERVTFEVDAYREEQDKLGMFIEEYVIIDETASVPAADAYRQYCMWCQGVGERPIVLTSFITRMRERDGIERVKDGRTVMLRGMRLRAMLTGVPLGMTSESLGNGGIFG